MSDHQVQQLIRMINQISANNLHHREESVAADFVATHLTKFWARGMKAQIIEYAVQNGADLSPVSRLAVDHLRRRTL